MVNPAFVEMTPEEQYQCLLKPKKPDAIYNLSEAVEAAQIYYRQAFPNAVPIGREKIRALYIFLFDMIIHSIDQDARISFLNFGTFRRRYVDSAIISNHVSKNPTYRRAHYRCVFNPSERFKRIINTDDEEIAQQLFEENAKTLDALDAEARSKEEEEAFKKELAEKWGVDISVFDEPVKSDS